MIAGPTSPFHQSHLDATGLQLGLMVEAFAEKRLVVVALRKKVSVAPFLPILERGKRVGEVSLLGFYAIGPGSTISGTALKSEYNHSDDYEGILS